MADDMTWRGQRLITLARVVHVSLAGVCFLEETHGTCSDEQFVPFRISGQLKHVVRSVARGAKTVTSSQIRRARATAVAAIVSVSVGVQGRFIRPTIATYVIVFALGFLYGTFIRGFESER